MKNSISNTSKFTLLELTDYPIYKTIDDQSTNNVTSNSLEQDLIQKKETEEPTTFFSDLFKIK